MKVLIDTNVIIDAITERYEKCTDSKEVINHILTNNIKGYITSKQITDIYYILRKYGIDEIHKRKILKTIINTFEVLPLTNGDLKFCLNSQINDYEDALLDEVSKVNNIGCIVTNNTKDFKLSKNIIFSPSQINALIKDKISKDQK